MDQKIENLLNLSLDATQQEREKSESLETGYNEQDRTWEVIVRYNGNLQEAVSENWQITVLSGGYAIIILPQEDVAALAQLPQIEYVEKPKRMYFQVDAGRRTSCISALQTPETGLFGAGILIAVIDSGVDYFHPDFRNDDGSTRILAIWDQTAEAGQRQGEIGQDSAGDTVEKQSVRLENFVWIVEKQENSDQAGGKPPRGFSLGVEYTKTEIDQALLAAQTGGRSAGLAIVPEQDPSGHGTEVLGIAAGNGRASGGQYRGVAPLADLIVVKLGTQREQGFPRTTQLMQAIEYVFQKAEQWRMPLAVNISFGNVYGSHRGTSLLETYIDMMAARGRAVIAVGTGNEGNTGGHVSGSFTNIEQSAEIELLVSDFETALNIQIWKNYADEFQISLIAPDGQMAGPFGSANGTSRYRISNTDLLVYYGEPSHYQSQQEIYMDFIPQDTYLDSGSWRILLTPQRVTEGSYNLWLNDARSRNPATRFLRPTSDTTMTIPSAASQVIAVGAYDARQNSYASFSGRGWPEGVYNIRPDLAAPGVEITTTASGGGYISVTGTSFAAPFVTGSAALLMEWGIVRGNDPYLYGEKVRAYLQKGARPLPGFEQWPNPVVGYGALCVRESLPREEPVK